MNKWFETEITTYDRLQILNQNRNSKSDLKYWFEIIWFEIIPNTG